MSLLMRVKKILTRFYLIPSNVKINNSAGSVFSVTTESIENVKKIEKNPDNNQPFTFGASLTGSSHESSKTPCQDAFSYKYDSKLNFSVIALSDGMGSVLYAKEGAEAAVDLATKKVIYDLKSCGNSINHSEILKNSVAFARKKLEVLSVEMGCQISQLGCTLIVVLISDKSVIAAHIGDGAVVAKKRDEVIIISDPGYSEYVNEVTPLTGSSWKNDLRVTDLIEDIDAVAIFSDGCQRASLTKTPLWSPHTEFFKPLFHLSNHFKTPGEGEQRLKEFLDSEKIKESSDDDKSMVISLLSKGDENNESHV